MRIEVFLGAYLIWNIYVFIAMGRDKRLAKLGQWRIQELNLLLMGFVLGGIGLFAGMKFFRHKTQHKKFVIGAPIMIFVNFLMLGYVYLQTLAK
ncbi:DUF1294 domain-containing protein [Desulfosporosinus sp. BICA1-9]|uniref:DUF1294 domain-containing protein n=1 Tax=Desulfosporosinus sp. BICA1-9 TaxID=1531958 RepID=UPI00054B6F3A|nr:DUF1294 domain-containing protein [Desulfosporosinus sp. BICA1-9]KJS49279.1 MAG: membrane protein [Peptococcaceae bacterium BRH_c23]KJS88073.1 MAG: membrane protein [Desulfosporosinus sp. BICA1-9]HBW39066.1 DUF1294 domain-containing protein [Desulfosporosinus sp.]